jgi:hypothetical protein
VHHGSQAVAPDLERPAALARSGVWDRALDEPTPKGPSSKQGGMGWLAIIARLGLALFFTAGLAAGQSLVTGTGHRSAYQDDACQYFFVWVFAALSFVVCRDA